MNTLKDTVCALSTPVGGAIAIVRLSGEGVRGIISGLFGSVPRPWHMRRGRLKSGGRVIDDCLYVFFAAPDSYTGEDMAELHCHGGTAVTKAAMELLLSLGARPAEPGEFTKRAYLAGKLELSQAEAVMDIISASSMRSALSAAQQLEGSAGAAAREVESILYEALAGLEAAIDFPDEAESDYLSAKRLLASAGEKLTALTDSGRRARAIRDGLSVVIAGRPNGGKSSLFNALCGREAAIVTANAGTTRDILTAQLTIGGVPVTLCDTAGLRDAGDEAEAIGVAKAKEAIAAADVVLWVRDPDDRETEEPEKPPVIRDGARLICVLTKADISDIPACADSSTAVISSVTGEGIDGLCRMIADSAPCESESAVITNARHTDALMRAEASVVSALAARDEDCCATDIRCALSAIGEISGESLSERAIDEIFSRFCVGK